MAPIASTIGMLYPGEMGAAVAALLRGRGGRVVTTLQQGGNQTLQRCRQNGLVDLPTLADVVRQSDVVFSLVPPAAAGDVAAAYARTAHLAPPAAIYVDLNSIRPESALEMGLMIAQSGRGFVDGSINGLAKNLTAGGTLFLSGQRAQEVAVLFDSAMRVRVLGGGIGRAKTMKMLLGGLSKGLCALFTELALTAHQRDMLDEMFSASGEIYPGIMAVVERMLPSYRQHAARRATEMDELKKTIRSSGRDPTLIAAVCRIHDMLADVPFDTTADAGDWTAASLIRYLADNIHPAVEPAAGENPPTLKETPCKTNPDPRNFTPAPASG